tara:strand:- start:1937 stop:2149 length:213 start_codon:yes stop_codon:yes gene_type:complete
MSTKLSVHRAEEITIDTSPLKKGLGWIDIQIKHEISEGHWVEDEITVHCLEGVTVFHKGEKDGSLHVIVA